MIRIAVATLCLVALCASPAWAVSFFDDFEAGVSGSVWTPWTASQPNNLLSTSDAHNITSGGSQSARAFASDPAAWNGYADFGASGDYLRAEVYIYEDFSNDGTNGSQPITNMLSLYGDSATPNALTDYIQLGVVPFYPSGSTGYGFRTRYNDATGGGIIDTGVDRKAGWTKLGIQVDALSDGGQIRFYVDDVLKGTSFRAGANAGAGGLSPVDLRYVRLGNNSKSYENFYYDNVAVVPEPASLALLGTGGLMAIGMLISRRRSQGQRAE